MTRRQDGDAETVIGVRPGLSSRQIVIVSHRDAIGHPGQAELSGTAVMLELARLFRARDLRKTLVLVSTSGATDGFTGARAWAEATDGPGRRRARARRPGGDPGRPAVGGPVVARPRSRAARRSSGPSRAAIRRQAGAPGSSRAIAQWFRRALPFTVSEQGVIADQSLPAVLVGVSGERGARPDERVVRAQMARFGRGVLRAVSALDAAGPNDGATTEPAFAGEPKGIVTLRNVLPDWAVRLLVGTLLLPALLTALDGFFRARRRHLAVGPWLAWLGATGLPVVLAWVWARALGVTGALDPPDAPVLPLPPVEWVAFASVAVVLAARLVRRACADPRAYRRRGRARSPAAWPRPPGPCSASSPRSCGS